MTILGISGTPRRGGNSEVLLEHALRPFEEAGDTVIRFLLSEKRIRPCMGCEACQKTGRCVIHDDMEELNQAYRDCDAMIIASPTYWRNVPAQLKALIDRSYPIWYRHPFTGKPGGAIVVGRDANGGQCVVHDILAAFFRSCAMPCVSLDFDVTVMADGPGDVRRQPDALLLAEQLGRKIASLF